MSWLPQLAKLNLNFAVGLQCGELEALGGATYEYKLNHSLFCPVNQIVTVSDTVTAAATAPDSCRYQPPTMWPAHMCPTWPSTDD
ncbi:hypothetical protein TNCV_881521 [Trichonephila clavipes]|nr:hypothetical protein TNCV_881521 [Trichonephila clavipes]